MVVIQCASSKDLSFFCVISVASDVTPQYHAYTSSLLLTLLLELIRYLSLTNPLDSSPDTSLSLSVSQASVAMAMSIAYLLI